MRITGRALAFSSEARLFQRGLGRGKIPSVRVAANVSEKVLPALHHLQEEQGELERAQLC